jgi:hypothetical protein
MSVLQIIFNRIPKQTETNSSRSKKPQQQSETSYVREEYNIAVVHDYSTQVLESSNSDNIRPQKSLSLESFEATDAFEIPSPRVLEIEQGHNSARNSQDILGREEGNIFDISCRDAYLIFRAFCKLSLKELGTII